MRVEFRRLGAQMAGVSLPRRLVLLDPEVLRQRGDFERIMVHEIFHFVWRRLSNARRLSWEHVIAAELVRCATGELGWSAEWRKNKVKPSDRLRRTPAWRRYACESFCDSAAWLYAGLRAHGAFTLPQRFRRLRRGWFRETFPVPACIPI